MKVPTGPKPTIRLRLSTIRWARSVTAATIHLAAAVPNFRPGSKSVPRRPNSWASTTRNCSAVQPRLEDNRFRVPGLPGLGVEFDETKAPQQEFRFWEAPHAPPDSLHDW